MAELEKQVTFIKLKEDLTSLNELLKGYTKPQLVDLGEEVSLKVKKSWNKSRMTETVAEHVLEQAETVYQQIIEEILLRLPDQKNQLYRVQSLEEIEGFIPLIQKGFFFISKDADTYIFTIPREISALVSMGKEESRIEEKPEQAQGDLVKAALLEEWKNRSVAIYGTYSISHMQKILYKNYGEWLTQEEIEKILN